MVKILVKKMQLSLQASEAKAYENKKILVKEDFSVINLHL